MSKEIQLSFDCTHEVVEESVTLDPMKRTLITRSPMVSKANTILKANFVEIPNTGLKQPAELVSFFSGAYNIRNTARTLTIKTASENLTIDLTVGEKIKTDRIVEVINTKAKTFIASNKKGHLALTDLSSVGEDSTIEVYGNAMANFGFDKQSSARGVTVYPSWSIQNGRIFFSKRIKENPVFQVSYITEKESCRRCNGSGRELNPFIDQKGHYVEIENENLLYQACMKALVTERGSNPNHPWYGSNLQKRIGSKSLAGIASTIREDVRFCLQQLQRMQSEQSRYQEVTSKERLYRVLSTEVLQKKDDPTVFLIDVEVQNASLEVVSLSIVFSTANFLSL